MYWLRKIAFLAIYALLLFRIGYIFGENDLVEDLSYSQFLANPSLYPYDFYVQHIQNHLPNERWIFALLGSKMGAYQAVCFFTLHLICSGWMLYGVHRLFSQFMENPLFVWTGMLFFLLILDNIHIGGNELYYNSLVPSFVSQTLCLWAIIHFLSEKKHYASLLLVPACLLHPLIGIQVWTILISISILQWNFNPKNPIFWICFLISCVWVGLIQANYQKGNISNELFFKIMEFRAAHHYFPHHFPIKNYLLLLPLGIYGYFFFRKHPIVHFYPICLFGSIVYMLGVYALQSPILLSTQWFSTTIWLELFSVIALFALLNQNIRLEKIEEHKIIFVLSCIGLLAVVLMLPPYRLFKNKPYQMPFFALNSSQAIALEAKQHTETNALFVIPFENTDFKYWSQRSVYVDYKSIVHQKAAIQAWYQRIEQIYATSKNLAQIHWMQKTEQDFLKLKLYGITHILTYKKHLLNFPIIAHNADWVIYELKN